MSCTQEGKEQRVKKKVPNFLGKNWMDALELSVVQIVKVECATQLNALLGQYTEIFKDELATIQNFLASWQLRE